MSWRLFVTGRTGFVGTHLEREIAGKPTDAAEKIVGPTEFVDLLDRTALREAVRACRPNAAIHLAGKAFVPDSFNNPRATFDANFTGTLNLLEALAESGFQGRFLYIGSGDVYGLVEEDALPIRETQPLRPRNPYAVSKVAAEALCYQWSQTGPFEVVMARPFNHIGPGQSERFAISDFAKQIAEIKLGRRPPKLAAGDIDVTRDFTDVRDVVRAYLLLLDKGRSGEAYNVCSGIEHRRARPDRSACRRCWGANSDHCGSQAPSARRAAAHLRESREAARGDRLAAENRDSSICSRHL